MPIKRSSDQKEISLEAFYTELIDTSTNHYALIGKRMLEMVKLINETFQETELWGLTSHANLIIQNESRSDATSFVVISNAGTDQYYFEYLLPERKRPWNHAVVQGVAPSLIKAKEYLLIAMKESEGWIGNSELNRLLKENKLN